MVAKLNLFIKIKKAKEKRLSEKTKLFQNKIYVKNIIIALSNNNIKKIFRKGSYILETFISLFIIFFIFYKIKILKLELF